jgi:hypothetical protein
VGEELGGGRFLAGEIYFSRLHRVHTASVVHSTSYKIGFGAFSTEMERQDYSLSSSAEEKMVELYIHSLIILQGVMLNDLPLFYISFRSSE